VAALHKKKSKSDPANYRPISLLAILSKVLEHVVAAKFKVHIAPLLNPHQFGFRPGHTTLDLLLNLVQRWSDALEKGEEVRAVALDISKAFDKVWHQGLLTKLARFGISGKLLDWFRSFLSNREQCVIVGTSASTLRHVQAGVPQGSVLAPLLFLVFINDLFDLVKNHLDVFADDSTLWSVVPGSSQRDEVATSLNEDLQKINKWGNDWLVTYNGTKTELLTVSRSKDVCAFRKNPKNVNNPHPPLAFDRSPLKEGHSLKLVGLTFSPTLSWKPHLKKVVRSARHSFYMIKRLRKYLSNAPLANIYKSHVRSHMEYCCPIWSGASGCQKELRELDQIQHRAVKLMGRSPAADNIVALEHRRVVAGLCVLHRIHHQKAPVAVHDLCPDRAPPRTRPTRKSSRVTAKYFAPPSIRKNKASDAWSSSFIPKFTAKWNELTEDIQNITDLQSFKRQVNNRTWNF